MKPFGFQGRRAWGLLAMLQGCAVGPNFHAPFAPDARLAPAAQAGPGAQRFVPGADVSGDWWRLFRSPALDQAVDAALAGSPSLAAAQGALVQAEASLRGAGGALLPSVSAGLGVQRDQASPATYASLGGQTAATELTIPPYTLYNATVSVSYTLDIWGQTRRQIEALGAEVEYQRDQLEAAYLALTGNVVTAQIEAASLQAQIDATNEVIGDERRMLGILRQQQALGGASGAQVLQQQAQLAQGEASLPPLQAQLAKTRDALAAYAGRLPGGAPVPLVTLEGLTLPRDLPLSLPSALAAQRPDIRAAAAQLHAATARLGIADAQLLPQITLSGQIGHESLTADTLFTPQTLLWNLAAGLTQPLFEGGALLANRRGAQAALQAAAAQYQQSVVTGFQNVADVLAALQYDDAQLQVATAARDAAKRSLELTQGQYRLGGEALTAVLNAQTAYQQAAITYVQAKAARLADTAALYVALGGGWWHRADVKQTCCGVIP